MFALPVWHATETPVARAVRVADGYWNSRGILPLCSGRVIVRVKPLPSGTLAQAWMDGSCTIDVQPRLYAWRSFAWPLFCRTMIHEVGHLDGLEHSPDPNSIMNANEIVTPAECKRSHSNPGRE